MAYDQNNPQGGYRQQRPDYAQGTSQGQNQWRNFRKDPLSRLRFNEYMRPQEGKLRQAQGPNASVLADCTIIPRIRWNEAKKKYPGLILEGSKMAESAKAADAEAQRTGTMPAPHGPIVPFDQVHSEFAHFMVDVRVPVSKEFCQRHDIPLSSGTGNLNGGEQHPYVEISVPRDRVEYLVYSTDGKSHTAGTTRDYIDNRGRKLTTGETLVANYEGPSLDQHGQLRTRDQSATVTEGNVVTNGTYKVQYIQAWVPNGPGRSGAQRGSFRVEGAELAQANHDLIRTLDPGTAKQLLDPMDPVQAGFAPTHAERASLPGLEARANAMRQQMAQSQTLAQRAAQAPHQQPQAQPQAQPQQQQPTWQQAPAPMQQPSYAPMPQQGAWPQQPTAQPMWPAQQQAAWQAPQQAWPQRQPVPQQAPQQAWGQAPAQPAPRQQAAWQPQQAWPQRQTPAQAPAQAPQGFGTPPAPPAPSAPEPARQAAPSWQPPQQQAWPQQQSAAEPEPEDKPAPFHADGYGMDENYHLPDDAYDDYSADDDMPF